MPNSKPLGAQDIFPEILEGRSPVLLKFLDPRPFFAARAPLAHRSEKTKIAPPTRNPPSPQAPADPASSAATVW